MLRGSDKDRMNQASEPHTDPEFRWCYDGCSRYRTGVL